MTPEEIICTLKELPLNNATDDEIINLIKEYPRTGAIITTYYPAIGDQGVPNLYVRATNYDPTKESVSSTDRLKYPPLKYNTEYQRANTPPQPMYYAVRNKSMKEDDIMSAIRTCLLETIADYDKLVVEGKRVIVSLSYNLYPLNLFSVFNWNEFQTRNPEMTEVNFAFEKAIQEEEPLILENTRIFLDYLSERFQIPVGQKQELYKPSAVIIQHILPHLEGFGVDGVVFPSTKVLGKELNVALIPNSFENKLRMTKVMDCEYKAGGIVEIQMRGDIQPGSKSVNFTEKVNIEIDIYN